MGRIRELLAHGGIAPLALLFAIAIATWQVASAISRVALSAIEQHIGDPESGGSGFDFDVLHTSFDLFVVVQDALPLILLTALFFVLWRIGSDHRRECPECKSEVPRDARVCRYCTADLPESAVS